MVDLGDRLIDILLVRDDQPQVEDTKEGWTLVGFQFYLLAIASLIAWMWTGAQCVFDCLKDYDWWLLTQDTAGAQYPRGSQLQHRQTPSSSDLPATMAELSRSVANRNSRSRKNVLFRPTRRVLRYSNGTRQLCNQISLDPGGGQGVGGVLLTLHPAGVWLPQALPGELGPVLQTHQSFWTEFSTSRGQAIQTTSAYDLPVRLEKSSSELPRLTPKPLVPKQRSEIGHRKIFHREPGSPRASAVGAKHCTCTCPCSLRSFPRPDKDSLSTKQADCSWTKCRQASSTNLVWNTAHLSSSETSEASLVRNSANDSQVGGDGISESSSPSSSHSQTSGESQRQDRTGWEVSDLMEDTALRLSNTSGETLASRAPEQRHYRCHHQPCERFKHRHFVKPKLKCTDHCSSFSVNEAVTDLLSGNFDIICSKYSGLNQKFSNHHGDVSSPQDNNRDNILIKKTRVVKTFSSCCSLDKNSIIVNQSIPTRCKQQNRPAFQKRLQKQAAARRTRQGPRHWPGPHTIESSTFMTSQVPRVSSRDPMNNCRTGDPKRKYYPKSPPGQIRENFASKQEETITQSSGHRIKQVTGALDLFHLDGGLGKANCDYKQTSSDQISRPPPYSRRRLPQRGSRLNKLRRRRCSYPYTIPHINRHLYAEQFLQKQQHFKEYRKESLSNFSFSASSLVTTSPLGINSPVLSSGHLGHFEASHSKHSNMLQTATEEDKVSPDKNEFPCRFLKRTRFPVPTERSPITPRGRTALGHVNKIRRAPIDTTNKPVPLSNEPHPDNGGNFLGRQEDSHPPRSESANSATPSTIKINSSKPVNQPTGHYKSPVVDAFETISTQRPIIASKNVKPPVAGTRPRHAQEKTASICSPANRLNTVLDRTGDNKISPRCPLSKGKRFEEYVYPFHPGRPSPLSPYTDSVTENVDPRRDQKMMSSNDSLMTGKSKSGAKISKLPVYRGSQTTGRLTPVQRPKDPTPNTPLAIVPGLLLKPGNNKSPDSHTDKAKGSVGDMMSSIAKTRHFNDFHSYGSGQKAAKGKAIGCEQRWQQRINLETGQRSEGNAMMHSGGHIQRHEECSDNLQGLNVGFSTDKRPVKQGGHSRLASGGSPCHSKQGSVGGSQYPGGQNDQSHQETCMDDAHTEATRLIFPKRRDALKPTPPHPREKKNLALSSRPAYPGVPKPSLKRIHPLKPRERPWRINARLAKDRAQTTAGLKDKGHGAN